MREREITKNKFKQVYYCDQCGKEFDPNRSDQRFCEDQCRWDYHNNKKKKERKQISPVLNIIKTNRRILRNFHNKGQAYITKDELLYRGYNLNYYTSISYFTTEGKQNTRQEGQDYKECYEACDFGIIPIKGKNKYKIIKIKAYEKDRA